jgi:flagellar protein FlgJ
MIQPLTGPGATLSPEHYKRVVAQAEELEGVFLNTLTKTLFSGIKTDADSMGGGFGEETWRSMQSEQLAAAMATNGGLGIAEQMLPDLLSMQEAANNQNNVMPIPGAYR